MLRPVPAQVAEALPAAAEVFAERGFEGTRIEDLAEATGIPKATLYYYFSGKEDLLVHLLGRLLARIAEAVQAAATDEGLARERLERVVSVQLEVLAAHPASLRVLVADLGRAGRIPEIADAIRTAFHEPVHTLLADGAEDGSLRPTDPDVTASAVFGVVTVPALFEIVTGRSLDADALAATLTPLLMEGIEAP